VLVGHKINWIKIIVMKVKNYYEILEITVSATSDQIKKAYRLKAIKYHPDKHFGDKYFSDKFIEIREAFEILSNAEKRAEYDILYKEFFLKEEPKQAEKAKEERRKDREKEDQFFYDPYKPYYSYQDRVVDETPQFNPRINHWGEILSDETDFFILPKKIGKIVSGFSTLSKSMNPPSGFFGSLFGSFKHSCSFMGVNGFAYYKISGNRQSIKESIEINFKDVTDLLVVSERRSLNFNYQNTAYGFEWSKNNKIVRDFTGLHYDKEDNPDRIEAIEYWTNKWAERYWTVYLLDNMEKELDKFGYIEFRIIDGTGYRPFIKLGIGSITFLDKKMDVTYNFNEIKRVYTKGTKLFIENKNYEKKFLFFETGNKNGIELMQLSNRQYFFKAMEILLGYKFS
jgi:curved DNA-binding protein CbpA